MANETIRLVVEIPKDLHRKLKVSVAQHDISIKEAVIKALTEYLERIGEE